MPNQENLKGESCVLNNYEAIHAVAVKNLEGEFINPNIEQSDYERAFQAEITSIKKSIDAEVQKI